MSLEMEFCLKMLGVLVISSTIFKIMMVMQKHKEHEAERKFRETMKMIKMDGL